MRVYPRVCGEATPRQCLVSISMGLSPRVRGSRPGCPGTLTRRGSIPACAGKPGHAIAKIAGAGVYPRVCGEASCLNPTSGHIRGLSPRVRGSLPRRIGHSARGGSIPACAGKPWRLDLIPRRWWVYPRVCGEAFTSCPLIQRELGLSPRVRGSLDSDGGAWRGRGSIPACAGKPVIL